MDIVVDSDLSDIEESLLDGPIEPYRFEPLMQALASPVSDDSEGSTSGSDHADEEAVEQRVDVSEWCHCGKCVNMPTVIERTCCKTFTNVNAKIVKENLACITEHEGFIVNCLNKHVLKLSFYDFVLKSGPPEEGETLHNLIRHIAYRRFSRWVNGLLGKKNRKVVPSCVVAAIRHTYPSDEYVGFKYPQ